MLLLKKVFVLIILNTFILACLSADKVQLVELENGWSLRNQNGSISLPVSEPPSGVYSALREQYGDVLHSLNDVNLRWIALDNWTYTNTFNVNKASYLRVAYVNLTLHGVDTVAEVRLNNVLLGRTNNMFLRYTYEVKSLLAEENILEIAIKSPIYAALEQANLLQEQNATEPRPRCSPDIDAECYRNLLRKLQMSFGIRSALAAPSMGLWKPVTLEFYEVAIMRDIDVALHRTDTHWVMDVRVPLETGLEENFWAELTFYAADLPESPRNSSRRLVTPENPVLEFQHSIPLNDVELWWPNGYGAQKLYPLYFTVSCWLETQEGPKLRAKTISTKTLSIGFRTLEIVEEEIDSGLSFLFKVNDVEIFMKGANYMPAHILPEHSMDEDRVRHILKSAKDAHMNMLRIWAGGLYESDYLYQLADAYGLLVWQDLPFTLATYPVTADFVQSVRLETRQNAQRLSHHPSLALFVTNDEIELALAKNSFNTLSNYQSYSKEYHELFVNNVLSELDVIARSDFAARPTPLRSTPSNGKLDRNLDINTSNPQDPNYGDVHIWDIYEDSWNPDIYPRPRFVSAYGFLSLPAFNSWQRSLETGDVLADIMQHRQSLLHDSSAIKEFLDNYLPLLDHTADDYIAALIYFSQIAQAMAMKVATELFRSLRSTNHKTMGALYGQLNDVWIAPSYSSIDYYGNYKLLYYWSRDFLAPTSIIALMDVKNRAVNVTLVREEILGEPEVFDVAMNMYLWSELYPKKTITWQSILRQDETQLKQVALDSIFSDQYPTNLYFLEFILSKANKEISRTYLFPSSISNTVGISDPGLSYVISWKYCNIDSAYDLKVVSFSLTIRIKRPALFVYIEIIHPDVKRYTLSANGFLQVDPIKVVHLEFEQNAECINIERKHIRVLTVNQFMVETNNNGGDNVSSEAINNGFATLDPSERKALIL